MVGLNGKRSRSGRDFPVPFSTLVMSSMVAPDWKKINQPSLSRDLNGSVVVRPSEGPAAAVKGDLIHCACVVYGFRFFGRPILQTVGRIILAPSLKMLPFLRSKKICLVYIYNMFQNTHKKDNC